MPEKPQMTPEQREVAQASAEAGIPIARIARALNVARTSVYRWVRRENTKNRECRQ